MEGTTRSAVVLLFLLISQGKSYMMDDDDDDYCTGRNPVCHHFKMIYTKTHYDVEKFNWVFKFCDFSP